MLKVGDAACTHVSLLHTCVILSLGILEKIEVCVLQDNDHRDTV